MYLKQIHKLLIALLLVPLALWPACGQAAPVGEYEIKAAFLYNFAKFVEWPKCTDCKADRPFVIGILGDDPFGADMALLVGKQVKERPLRVVRAATLDELGGCDVLFISNSIKDKLAGILKKLGSKPVLTVGDTAGFAQAGVMINLYQIGNKIRFEINSRAAEKAGLKISSHLLRLARIVEPSPGGAQ